MSLNKNEAIVYKEAEEHEKRYYDYYWTREKIEEHQDYKKIVDFVFDLESAEQYKIVRTIKQGSFGKVSEVQPPSSRKQMALKTILKRSTNEDLPQSLLQEVLMVSSLKHKYIVRFIKCVTSKCKLKHNKFHLLFELCAQDLENIIFSTEVALHLVHIKTVTSQMLRGLNYMHRNSIMHRDVKPGNILISMNGVLKLADFGMSCYFGEKANLPLFHYVCTLGYRAPELLLGSNKYDSKVDIWSAAVITAEMYLRKYLIRGESVRDHLACITRLCGNIEPMNWPGCDKLPYGKRYELTIAFPQEKRLRKCMEAYVTRYGKKKVLSKDVSDKSKKFYDEQGMDFLEKILKLYPEDRPSAEKILKHPWFKTEPRPQKDVADLLQKYNTRESARL